jgi:phosphonatase-like hydrolase
VVGRYTLACLDMAGTTICDDGAVDEAFRAGLASAGIHPGGADFAQARAFVHQTMGWSKADVFAALLTPTVAARATAEFAASYEATVDRGGIREIPGATAVLHRLRAAEVRVCLTTGFAPTTRDAVIAALGWSAAIDLALSPGDVARGRPAPDMVFAAMDRLEVSDPAAVAVVGDTVSDLEAGTRAEAGAVIGVLSGAHDAATLSAVPHSALIPDVTGLIDVLDPAGSFLRASPRPGNLDKN